MVSFYWHTRTFPRSLYHAEIVKNLLQGGTYPISKEKPLGYSLFSQDLAILPKAWAEDLYPNLVFFKAHQAVSTYPLRGLAEVALLMTCRVDISPAWSDQSNFWMMLRTLYEVFVDYFELQIKP